MFFSLHVGIPFFPHAHILLFSAQQNWKIDFNNRERETCNVYALHRILAAQTKKLTYLKKLHTKTTPYVFLFSSMYIRFILECIVKRRNIVCATGKKLCVCFRTHKRKKNQVEPMTDQKWTNHQRHQRQQHTICCFCCCCFCFCWFFFRAWKQLNTKIVTAGHVLVCYSYISSSVYRRLASSQPFGEIFCRSHFK